MLKHLTVGAAMAAGLSITSVPALAQSNEDTIAVTVDVNVTPPAATITGLEDMFLPISTALPNGAVVSVAQPFCLYTPFRYFNISVNGTNDSVLNDYRLIDLSQSDPALKALQYSISITDQISGNKTELADFHNRGVFRNIDSTPFVTDENCSTGENLGFEIIIRGSDMENGNGRRNSTTIAQISDGQSHSYTDTLTILVEPYIN